MKIISICGQKATGKDLVANLIIEQLNQRGIANRKVEFGQLIKSITCQVFNLNPERDYHQFIRGTLTLPNGKLYSGKDVVKCLEARLRLKNPSVFIDDVEDQLAQYKAYHREHWDDVVFVIPDLRFKQELKWCRSNNATIVKVKRDTGVYDPNAIDQLDIDDYFVNHVIDNNHTEQELRQQVQQFVDQFVAK